MVQWEIPRAPTSVLLLTRFAAARGVSETACLRGTGIPSERLTDPDFEVSAKQEERVLLNIVDEIGDEPGLGLDAGQLHHVTAFGIYGFALISSPTMRSAIEVALRFLDLTFAFCRMHARESDDEFQLVFDQPDLPRRLHRFEVEREAAAVRLLQQEVFTAPVALTRMSFVFSPPPPRAAERYKNVFGVDVEFDASENQLAFPLSVADLALPQANEHTAQLAQEQCRELLARRRARTGLAGEVRDLLLARPSDPPDAERVAASLHLSPRTLRHKLAGEGTSFRALLDEVRQRLAEELLTTGFTVSEVAERLGYLELSSFSQAFRRWNGVGPREYRSQRPDRAR